MVGCQCRGEMEDLLLPFSGNHNNKRLDLRCALSLGSTSVSEILPLFTLVPKINQLTFIECKWFPGNGST